MMPNKPAARWTHFKRVPAFQLSPLWRNWVLDPGSLTKKLIQRSQGNFRVRILQQRWGKPTPDEARLLQIDYHEWVLIREVELLGHEQIWVTARSLIPNSTLTGAERQLRHLGTKPLGAFLFNSRSMRRGAMQIQKIRPLHSPSTDPAAFAPIWGRRSVFYLHNKPLLVSEFFSQTLACPLHLQPQD